MELRPCSRLGKVAAGVKPVGGIGEIREDEQSIRDLNQAMVTKYGLMYRLVLLAERVVTTGARADRPAYHRADTDVARHCPSRPHEC